jgi:uncharacterized protein YciI
VFAIILITHSATPDEVAAHTARHRAYLRALYERGKILAFGPFAPRGGGALLLRVRDEQELAEISEGEPYRISGVASHSTHVWMPTMGGDRLEALASEQAP